jgi:2-polyprenyl-3-methyl-5-hydroxy-6-metoxy-1,4-benzoquinol methylase
MLSSYCSDAHLGPGLRGVGKDEVQSLPLIGEATVGSSEVGKEGEGLKILDLGCGWGSLGLFLAEVCFVNSN